MRALRFSSILLSLVLLGLTPAYAKTVTVRDATRDVLRHDANGVTGAPDEGGADITTFVIRHTRDAVTLTLNTRRRVGTGGVLLDYSVKTPSGAYSLAAYREQREFKVRLTKGNRRIRCQDLRLSFTKGWGPLGARIPRSCLNNPKWVQADIQVSRIRGGESNPYTLRDTAGIDGQNPNVPSYSRRVHVGR